MNSKFKLTVTVLLILSFCGFVFAIDVRSEWLLGSFNGTSTDIPNSPDSLLLGYLNGSSSDDLNAYWRFDNTLNDFSGSGIDSTSSNNISYEAGILSTDSLVLNGSKNSYVVYPDQPGLKTSEFTISGWIKPESSSIDMPILEKSTGDNRGYYMLVDNYFGSDTLGLYMKSSQNSVQRFRTQNTLQTGVWQHVAARYNGTDVSLFIDGEKQSLSTISAATYNVSNQDLIVGATSTRAGGDYFTGNIDEFKILRTSLSDEKIRAEHLNGVPYVGEYSSKNFTRNIKVDWYEIQTQSLLPSATELNITLNTKQAAQYDSENKNVLNGSSNISFNLQKSKEAYFTLKGNTQDINNSWQVQKIEPQYVGIDLLQPSEGDVDEGGNVTFSYILDSSKPGSAQLVINNSSKKTKQINSGQNTVYQTLNLDEGYYEWNVQFQTTTGDDFTSNTSYFTHVNKTDYEANSIFLNETHLIEDSKTKAIVNVSNNAPDPNITKIEANFFNYRSGQWQIYETSQKTFDSSGGDSKLFNFSFNPKLGPNKVEVIADPQDTNNETNEANNQKEIIRDVPLYSIFYGNAQKTVSLDDYQQGTFYDFGESDINGTVYYLDSDASFSFGSLKPLQNYQDLQELDQELNSTGFNDSIENLWGNNQNFARTSCFTISGSENCDVPVTNSSENSFFDTGIVYDGGSTFQSGDAVAFISNVVPSEEGSYGTYDHETRIPANLPQAIGSTNSLDVYMEVE